MLCRTSNKNCEMKQPRVWFNFKLFSTPSEVRPLLLFSPRLHLNETSDFEAVAKLLKVCQWVFASRLKDTLRLALNKRGQPRDPQHPACTAPPKSERPYQVHATTCCAEVAVSIYPQFIARSINKLLL